MTEFLLALIIATVVFILLWIGLSKKKNTPDKAGSYACSACGAMDCICHKVNDTKE